MGVNVLVLWDRARDRDRDGALIVVNSAPQGTRIRLPNGARCNVAKVPTDAPRTKAKEKLHFGQLQNIPSIC